MATKKRTNGKARRVVVTTGRRGVFYGQLVEERDQGRTVVLEGARCAIHWATKGGFFELAEHGPNSKSRIGSRAPRVVLYEVTSTTDCTDAAAEAWERA